MSKIPLVSVCVVTYQHVNYIKKCLDGILMQQTTFSFEIILGEDESIDGTRELCIRYANKNPDRIKLFLRNRNDSISFKNCPSWRNNFVENLKRAKGKYIAICDGDDYWTDPLKLQKQVNFLEKNSSYILVGHNSKITEESIEKNIIMKDVKERYINISTKDLIKRNPFISSMTMFKNIGFCNLMKMLNNFTIGDWPLFTMLSYTGKCRFYSESVGYYRVHSGGISYNNRRIYSKYKNDLINRINHAKYWNAYSVNKYMEEENFIVKKRSRQISNLAIRNFDFRTAIYYSQFIDTTDLKKINLKF